MNSLAKVRLCARLLANQQVRAYASSGGESHWLRDNVPGPFPKTEEEKIAAAKKYGLLREEYEPYAHGCAGDYPDLPTVSVDQRDDYVSWTDTYHKRMFNDPIHANEYFLLNSRMSTEKFRYSGLYMFSFLIGMTLLVGLPMTNWLEPKTYYPRFEKQYPKPGVVHYTFDLVGADTKEHH
ncbi:UNVERIFIED_CONTAM: hypothetical protein PYX00_003660 [Menopon gallinae]|uniref:NADH dehydrogenase [ubiquinone] 1 beta subcomplex subunit 8, mitochondrial n=1 Tax=Menopon gallinae TaxID=328185 RepID=A0AAW2I1H5_9NEOP